MTRKTVCAPYNILIEIFLCLRSFTFPEIWTSIRQNTVYYIEASEASLWGSPSLLPVVSVSDRRISSPRKSSNSSSPSRLLSVLLLAIIWNWEWGSSRIECCSLTDEQNQGFQITDVISQIIHIPKWFEIKRAFSCSNLPDWDLLPFDRMILLLFFLQKYLIFVGYDLTLLRILLYAS